MKALGMYVFAGSMSIGIMQAGFKVNRVLEITDEMIEQNTKHFIHNFPDIPVITPNEWDNENYINNLEKEDYDLLYGNPPCSGLSNINRNASASNEVNRHIYKFTDTVKAVRPKSFIMENAPTLISRGKIILDYMVSKLDDYIITIIRDYAGNHEVAMKRQRTLVVGFRKDVLPGFPMIMSNWNKVSIDIILNRDTDSFYTSSNRELVPERTCKDLEKLYNRVLPGDSIMTTIAKYNTDKEIWDLDIPENFKIQALRLREKINDGKGAFEKSPSRLVGTSVAPSLASVMEFIHPIEDRPLYIREYARLMGYPDTFEFVKDAKVPYVQAIAQGVPVPFAKWIAENIYNTLEHKKCIIPNENKTIRYMNMCNQNNANKTKFFTIEEFINTDNICK